MVKVKGLSRLWIWGVFLTMALQLAASPCFSDEQKPRVMLNVKGEKEVHLIRDGKNVVELAPMDETARGDILVYTLTYQNNDTIIVKNLTVVDPIPEHTEYVSGSAEGKDTKILFSINGGATYLEPPITYKSLDSNGKETVQTAPPELYTHIKWIVQRPVHPNETGTTTFKVKVK